MRIRMVALTLVAATLVVVSPAAGAQEVETRPNVIVIMTDDMRADLLTPKYMPSTYELLSSEGMMFTNAVSNIPNCCPARASFLTGLLPRHHQVWVNVIKDSLGNSGGHGLFKELFESTGRYLPCWLEEAGYSTMLAGKYLNEYPFGQPKTFKENLYVPPCWTEWYGMNYAKSSSEDPVIPGSGGLLYKRYLNHDEVVLNQHGRVRFVRWRSSSDNPYLKAGKADGTRSMARPSGEITRKKNVKSVYATDVVTNRTRSFIRRKSEAGQPFFAFVSMYA
ncbi:MAG TPA: sulfatase-like hydrolase/transferase, partial [Candidatus Saccharimonadales bacterium]